MNAARARRLGLVASTEAAVATTVLPLTVAGIARTAHKCPWLSLLSPQGPAAAAVRALARAGAR